MKKLVLYIAVLGAVLAGCQRHEIDNRKSNSNLEMQISASVTSLVLDETQPDAVALTVSWTPAHDYGEEYVMTYEYSVDVTTSQAAAQREYEDDGIFTRSYTNGELQNMLTGHFGVGTRKLCNLRFSVSASYSGPRVVIPDQSTVIVSVRTYGARQFAADKVYVAGTAIGPDPVELQAKSAGVYMYQAALNAGKFNFPVDYEGERNMIVPAGAKDTAVDGNAQSAEVTDETVTAGWTIPAADSYRITLNFNNKTVSAIPTSQIFEVDKIFLGGTAAAGEEPIEVTPTLENPAVYAFHGELAPGELFLPVEYDGATNFAIVPSGSGHDLNDGETVAFGQALASQAAGNKYWTIPAAGVYRIVVNTDARTIAIYSPATDPQNKKVSYNNTAAGINPFEQEVTELWMWGGFNAFDKDADQSQAGFQKKYTLAQSLANPYVFVYYGDTLPRKSAAYHKPLKDTGEASGPGWLTFLVSNIQNNVYAYGSTAEAKRNNYAGKVETALGETATIVGGQSDNRYAYFIIPSECNYVEVNIDAMTVVFDKR